MYTLTNNGETLFDPRLEGYSLGNPNWVMDENRLSSLTFTIYPTNPQYGSITKSDSIIGVYNDGTLLQLMRPVYAKAAWRGGIEYRCEELAARLNDVKRRPGYFNGTVAQYVAAMVSDYNSHISTTPTSASLLGDRVLRKGMTGSDVAEMERCLIGLGFDCGKWGADGSFGGYTENTLKKWQTSVNLSATGVLDATSAAALIAAATAAGLIIPDAPVAETDYPLVVGNIEYKSTETITAVNSDYVGYWDEMQTQLVQKLGGYLVPRYGNGNIYIDYLGAEDLPLSSQVIEFAENMLQLVLENTAAETFTVLIPLGSEVEVTPAHPEEPSSLPLTIESVNGGKDYLESEEGINLYGRREVTHQWDDIESASDLLTAGQAYLAENAVKVKETITLTAADLHNINVNVEALRWMTRVRTVSTVHGIDEYYPLTRMQIQLANPTQTRIELGTTQESLTDRVSGSENTVNNIQSKPIDGNRLADNTVLYGSFAASTKTTLQAYTNQQIAAIGSVTQKTPEATTVANNTQVSLDSITLNKGLYIIQGVCSFAANATGYREIALGSNASSDGRDRFCISRVQGAADKATVAQVMTMVEVTANGYSIYLNVKQNSGSSLSATGGIQYLKIR